MPRFVVGRAIDHLPAIDPAISPVVAPSPSSTDSVVLADADIIGTLGPNTDQVTLKHALPIGTFRNPETVHMIARPIGSPVPAAGPDGDVGKAWIDSHYPRSWVSVPTDPTVTFIIANPATVESEGQLILEFPN